ncbi:cupin domain-containing protein [Paraburkholderia sp. MM5477-R1]|uniref:cupin domain-containing protein n=1 Tax=Paraburkholderia sp. MM5477-R1 TaxID=2991062 RepID=UPI003D1F6699
MKVHQIKQSVTFEGLEDRGTVDSLGADPIRISGLRKTIEGSESVNTGIFECTAGSYLRKVKEAEVMHILSGRGRFTPDNEDAVHFEPGDTMFFASNTQGLWEVDETMRKVYVIL